MSDARAESLLKSALEKIVYFEARSGQVQGDLVAARTEVEQLKRDLTQAAGRELELRRQTAELEVAVGRAHREKEELGRLNDALKMERAALLGKLIESSRIHAAGEAPQEFDPSFDLASFISELRNEVLNARAPVVSSLPAHLIATGTPPSLSVVRAQVTPLYGDEEQAVPPAGSDISQHAERLLREGRLRVSAADLSLLSPQRNSRSEETLFGFSVRELSAPDAPARIRAAERLKALGEKAAAPALAAALHSETEAEVLVGLLHAFAPLATIEGVAVVAPLLDSPVPEVRVAALKTLLTLDPAQAGPRLAAAAQDPDPSVRRRASLLALGLDGDQAFKQQRVTHDDDPDVRRLSALALGAAGGERARSLLLEALRDTDVKVRRAASQSLSRMLGVDCSAVVDLEEATRRREIRRLATLPIRAAAAPRMKDFAPPMKSFELAPAAKAEDSAAKPAAVPETPVRAEPEPRVSLAPASNVEALCGTLVLEMRSAIRGRSLGELSVATRLAGPDIEEACSLLIARGQVVRRGLKYFVA